MPQQYQAIYPVLHPPSHQLTNNLIGPSCVQRLTIKGTSPAARFHHFAVRPTQPRERLVQCLKQHRLSTEISCAQSRRHSHQRHGLQWRRQMKRTVHDKKLLSAADQSLLGEFFIVWFLAAFPHNACRVLSTIYQYLQMSRQACEFRPKP